MSILVVAAHPDDEVLGCGGTMARAAAAGEEVQVLVLGEGSTSRSERRQDADDAPVLALRSDAERAAAVLGLAGAEVLDLPDNRFDSLDLLDIVKIIEDRIDRHRPRVVYTQHGGDVNVDHRCTYQAVLAATRPVPGQSVEEVLAFEVGSSTEWAFQTLSPSFRPSVFVEISGALDVKLEAMACYEEEARPFPHPRSPESLRAQAVRWGSTVGVEAAEAFEPVRIIR